MRNKIKAFVEQIAAHVAQPAFDPSRFNDPLAMNTQWTPLVSGGTNIRTHKLVLIDFNRMEFKPSWGSILFCAVFLLTGLGVMIGFIIAGTRSGTSFFQTDFLMPVVTGLIFTLVGVFLYYTFGKPVVFDNRSGYFWKCWKAPDQAFDLNAMEAYTKLSDIYALQLLSEYVRGNKSSYHSYELNLVMKDGSRVNVVDHGSHVKLREDARTLADFLGKPVWDAI
ncbi:MAG: hypothetical protein LC662_03550 [Rhodothermaceae bacterium]|nr:hypothetical protein [Rhodothermaceae bacterium]